MPRRTSIWRFPLILLEVALHLHGIQVLAIALIHDALQPLLVSPRKVVRISQFLILIIDFAGVVTSCSLVSIALTMLTALTVRWLVYISTTFVIIVASVVIVALTVFALRPLFISVTMVEFLQLLDWQVFIAIKLIRIELLLWLIHHLLPSWLLIRTVSVQVATFGDADSSLVRVVGRRRLQRPSFIGKVHLCRQRVTRGWSFAIALTTAILGAIFLVEGLAQMWIQLHVIFKVARSL